MKRVVVLIALMVLALGAVFAYRHLLETGDSSGHGEVSEEAPVVEGSGPVTDGATPPRPEAVDETPTLDSSLDYSEVMARQLPLAKAGDPDAMAIVARILEYCANYSTSPTEYLAGINVLAEMGESSEGELMRQAAGRVEERCERVSDKPIQPSDHEEFLEQAANKGHIGALVRLANRNAAELNASDMRVLVEAAAKNDDPNVLLDAAGLIAIVPEEQSNHPIGASQFDSYAWAILACRRGASCKQGQRYMDAICLSGQGCGFANIEDLVRRAQLPEKEARGLDQRIQAIEAWVNDGMQKGERM